MRAGGWTTVFLVAVALTGPASAHATLAFPAADTLSSAGVDAYEPALGVNEAGNAVAAWSELGSQNANSHVLAATRGTGGWGAATPLSGSATDASGAAVAIDTSGNAVAAWREGSHLQASFRPAGGTWGPSEDPSGGMQASDPAVVIDSSGRATVAFRHASGGGAEVWAARRVSGTWETPALISPSGATFTAPKIATDLDGDVAVAWATGGAPGVWVAERRAGEAWRTALKLTTGAGVAPNVSLAKDVLTDATAVGFCEHPQALMGCFPSVAVRSAGSVTFGGTVPLSDVSSATPLLASAGINPSPAGADGGTFLALYTGAAGASFSAVRSPDTDWSTPQQLTGRPQLLAMNEEGDGLAAFRDPGGGPMQAMERVARGTWSSPVPVPGPADDSQPSAIALDRAGHPTIVWVQPDAQGKDRVLAGEGGAGPAPPGPPPTTPSGPAFPGAPASPSTLNGDAAAALAELAKQASQALGSAVTQSVTCSAACDASAAGDLSVPGAARLYKLRASKTVRIKAHGRATLRLGVPAVARAAARGALKRHRRVRALIRVRVRPVGSGKPITLSRSLRLVAKKP